MSTVSQYNFVIDKENEILVDIPEDVFTPTGTSVALIQSIRENIIQPGKTLDLGAGSGILGISLHQFGQVQPPMYASDLSQEAVDCIETNFARYGCPIIAKCGSLFEPWENEKFDYIVDDVSGVAEVIANVSPWFKDVPCQSGEDGTTLVTEVIQSASNYLNPAGKLFFPAISFSNIDRIVKVAGENFSHVELLSRQEWPLPKNMYPHMELLKRLQEKGLIQFKEKFGMILWFTEVYVAYNR